jgi:hypothetical protein
VSPIEVRDEGDIRWIGLNRPDKRNAIDQATTVAFSAALADARKQPCQARRLCETPAVTGDERPAMRVSALFDPEPQTWGLRGDPYLWRALRAHLAGQDIPTSPGGLTSLLHQAFRELAGVDLASDPAASAYLEQYAHGGMSSGTISLEAHAHARRAGQDTPVGPALEHRP